MRVNFEYKSDDEIASERARFEAHRYYFKQIDPDSADDWFDPEIIDRWENNKQNVQYNIKNASKVKHISMVRVPTKCPKCKRAWAIEILDGSKNMFGPQFLDQSVYKTIPCEKGLCHECKEYNNG
tara:strand:- start:62 stop:436 length:375 start_codon:yes stop_codon:yes gene_type:complete